MSLRPARIAKPGRGTLAALRHVCPHCGSVQGVRCVTPSGDPREHAHSKRMRLARIASMNAPHKPYWGDKFNPTDLLAEGMQ